MLKTDNHRDNQGDNGHNTIDCSAGNAFLLAHLINFATGCTFTVGTRYLACFASTVFSFEHGPKVTLTRYHSEHQQQSEERIEAVGNRMQK